MSTLREEEPLLGVRAAADSSDWLRQAAIYHVLRAILPGQHRQRGRATWRACSSGCRISCRSAPTLSGCRPSTSRPWTIWATTSPIIATSIRYSARWTISTALVFGRAWAGLKIMIDLVFSHTSDRHPWFEESRADRTNPKAELVCLGGPQARRNAAQQLADGLLAARPGPGTGSAQQYYLHDFLPSQPSLDFAHLELRKALLDIAEFWVVRGVDAFRIDTMNSYFHHRDLDANKHRRHRWTRVPSGPEPTRFATSCIFYDRAQRGDIAPLEKFRGRRSKLLGAFDGGGRGSGNRLKASNDQALVAAAYTYCLPKALLNAEEMAARIAEAIEQSPDGRIGVGIVQPRPYPPRHPFFGAHGEGSRAGSRA